MLLPDGYVKPHSQQDYAVLVTRDPDGLSTITVVPWNSISRIILRAVKQVPGEVVRAVKSGLACGGQNSIYSPLTRWGSIGPDPQSRGSCRFKEEPQ